MTTRLVWPLLAALSLCMAPPLCFAFSLAPASIPEEAAKHASPAAFDAARNKAIESVRKGQAVSDVFIKRWFGDLPSSAYATPMRVVGSPAGPTEIFFAKNANGGWSKVEEVAVPGAPSGEGLRKAKASRPEEPGSRVSPDSKDPKK